MVAPAPPFTSQLASLVTAFLQPLQRFVLSLVVFVSVLYLSTRGGSLEARATAGTVGIGVVLYLRRHLNLVIVGAVLLVALVPVLPAALLSAGVPLGAMRQYGHIKDVLVAASVLALVDGARRRPGPLDSVERWGGSFVLLCTFYLLLPIATPGSTVPPFSIRMYGWRLLAEWLVLLLALRRIRLPEGTARVALRSIGALALLEAIACAYQYVAPTSWNDVLVSTVKVQNYLSLALDSKVGSAGDINVYNSFAGMTTVRVGGLALNTLATAGTCVVLVGALTPSLLGRRLSVRGLAPLVGAVVAVGLTLTRSAILGSLIAVGFVLLQRQTIRLPGRGRAIALALGTLVLVSPVIIGSRLATRVTSAFNGTDKSAADHTSALTGALPQLGRKVLGEGLGTGPGVGFRFNSSDVLAENAYLQVALELGVLGAVLFVGFLVCLIRDCLRNSKALGGSPVHLGVAAAVVGLMTMSLFLDPWIEYGTIFPLAAVAGVAGARSQDRRDLSPNPSFEEAAPLQSSS